MARKIWRLSLLIVMVISLGVFALKGFGKEKKLEEKNDSSAISEKIDEILKNQQDIIAQLEDIKKELDIIRIRASRR
ncbi:hypothetical protein ACFL28_00285 [Candidatus Omnitrophota bacterium]